MRQIMFVCLVVALIAGVIHSSETLVETAPLYPWPAHMVSSIDDVFRHL
ncbi:hypothetical protein [Pseudomonas sp. TCU-HL1]|nr:hypothetical protein [Pseudomonas sp. TCU-HL1]AOE86047.1 hypothetical protein THL1_3499 [Pseudomonas sp. TCU-HL1]